jgi:PTH1 family peptidyl-tRNA hydrolase
MKIIIGLGNPGSKYTDTRHNFGFMALDYFQSAAFDFSPWQKNEKFQSLLSEGEFGDEKIILAKPQTMMNLSGRAVKALAGFYKIDLSDIWILHDDIDLPLGALRLSQNSGAAGHKGVRSIIDALGSKNFARWRLGIKSDQKSFMAVFFSRFMPVEKFVLQKFNETEKEKVQAIIEKVKKSILFALKEGVAKAQNQINIIS